MNTGTIELVEGQKSKAKPAFETEADYLEFLARFQEQVRADLEKFREARRLSEELAKRHLVY